MKFWLIPTWLREYEKEARIVRKQNIFSYKWWWSRIGGRQWTYIIRDARQKYPTPWMLGVMMVSATIGHYFWSWWLLVSFGVLLIGILWGHLWWGTRYIPDQGLKAGKK